jgi:hypothetical protein
MRLFVAAIVLGVFLVILCAPAPGGRGPGLGGTDQLWRRVAVPILIKRHRASSDGGN